MPEPESFMQRRWQCEHCRRSWSQKSAAVPYRLADVEIGSDPVGYPRGCAAWLGWRTDA